MNAFPRTAALLGVVLLCGTAAAQGPPGLAELPPLTAATWPKWSERLRGWSGADYEQAQPAFARAFEFIRTQQKTQQGNRVSLPKAMEKDPVAWMVSAGSYLNDTGGGQSPVVLARLAAFAAGESVRKPDGHIARAYFWLATAIQREQFTPPDKGGPAQPNRGRLRDALKALNEARALDPKVPWASAAELGKLAAEAEQWAEAQTFLQQALQQKPDDGPLLCYYGRALLHSGKRDEAAAQLARARALGTDPASVLDTRWVKEIDDFAAQRKSEADRKKAEEAKRAAEEQRRKAEEQRRNAPGFWTHLGWWTFGFSLFYGTIMGLMCLAGWLLARRTHGQYAALLKEAPPKSMSASGQVARTVDEMRLGRFYLIALIAALVLFYLSLPFVLFGLLLVFLMTLGLSFFVNRNSGAADVHTALLRASGGGMTAIFKATFARTGTGGFGKEKDREDCPKLFAAIDEVARNVDTEPPDELWLSPGADFWVRQEGRGPFGVFGSRKRVLTIGMCVLDVLTVSELKAILAHEFAHFSHADTHWNRFLFQVTLSLRTAMREMARTGGVLTYGNPFYWFFWLYSKSYSMLSAGFSRSREFLADRMACAQYGSNVFTTGLRKVCTDGSYFEMTIYQNIARLLKQKKAFVNMYVAFRKHRDEGLTESERRKLHKKLLADEPSMFASHPTFQERSDASKPLPPAVKTENAPALSLFEKAEEVEKEMTDFLTEAVANYINA
jgi:Zn-dependent protease with chaperone function